MSKKIKTDPKLLEILVCPLTKSALRYDPRRQELVCKKAALAFPIRNGIPFLLASEARKISL
ncbi:MAG TPA: Trm112 family protein [Sphingomonadales bacterium]|nr:Trm112 family protein [Sphingomonadales bacterium]